MMRTLHTADDEFDALHRALDKARSTTAKVAVDRQALTHRWLPTSST